MRKQKAISKINPLFLKGIAHRGLHNEILTENGLKAFENAINHNVAFEFDIHLTKDKRLIVCHDENLKRTTGKEGIIEHLTLKEIKEGYKLLDGEEVPTLDEVFELNQERVPMVIELKVFEKNYKELAQAAKVAFKKIKDKRNALIISFDPRSLWPLKHEGFIRSLLVAKSDEYTWFFRHTVESVDLDKKLFEEKRVKRYVKTHFTNIWTIESADELKQYLPYIDTATYQFIEPDEVRKILDK